MNIFEAIVNYPQNIKILAKSRLELFQSYENKATAALSYIKKSEKEIDDLRYFENKLNIVEYSDYKIKELFSDLHNCYDIILKYSVKDLRNNLYTYAYDALLRAKDIIKDIEEILVYHDNNLEDQFNLKIIGKTAIENYGYNEDSDKEEYQKLMKFFDSYSIISKILIDTKNIINRDAPRLYEYQKMLVAYDIEKYKPDHDETEILYHVSVHCDNLEKDGFLEKKPKEHIGVGYLGMGDETISFTHSMVIANNILRAFREVWMIAHGKITIANILDWSKKEGILDDVVKSVKGLNGYDVLNPDKNKPKDKLYILSYLYRYYLTYSPLRNDPVIVNIADLAEQLKTIDYKNIGILECEVKLEPNTEYKFAEAEFRVPASAVLSVKRKQ